jgi:hypothetical protein
VRLYAGTRFRRPAAMKTHRRSAFMSSFNWLLVFFTPALPDRGKGAGRYPSGGGFGS